MIYVGIYALIYLHTILGEGIVSRDGLPRGVLPSGILKIEKYCPGLKVPVSFKCQSSIYFRHFGALGNVQMTARTVNVNVTDDVISLDPESDAFIGGRAFNLHALPDDFQVN